MAEERDQRAESRELLFYFLLHPQGATREQAMEALWPDTDVAKGVDKFWFQMRTVRNLRVPETRIGP